MLQCDMQSILIVEIESNAPEPAVHRRSRFLTDGHLSCPKSNANAAASVFARGRAQICRRGKGPPLHASREDRPNSAAGPVATAASRPSQVAAGRAGPAACGGGHLAPRGGRKKRNSRDRTSRVFMWRRTWNDPAKNCPMQMNWLRFTPMTMMQDSVKLHNQGSHQQQGTTARID